MRGSNEIRRTQAREIRSTCNIEDEIQIGLISRNAIGIDNKKGVTRKRSCRRGKHHCMTGTQMRGIDLTLRRAPTVAVRGKIISAATNTFSTIPATLNHLL